MDELERAWEQLWKECIEREGGPVMDDYRAGKWVGYINGLKFCLRRHGATTADLDSVEQEVRERHSSLATKDGRK